MTKEKWASVFLFSKSMRFCGKERNMRNCSSFDSGKEGIEVIPNSHVVNGFIILASIIYSSFSTPWWNWWCLIDLANRY